MDLPSPDARAKELRAEAKTQLRKQGGGSSSDYPQDRQSLIDELELQKIELELQAQQLKRTHAELADSRNRLSALYEHAPNGYLTLDSDGVILELNAAALAMLGTCREQALNTPLSDYLHASAQDDWNHHRRAVLETGSKQCSDLRLRQPGDSPRYVYVESVRCAYTADPICHSIWVDVTTRIEAQRSLIALKNTLEQRVAEQIAQIQLQAKAISSLAEGVLITTSDLDAPGPEIIFINEAISRITGYSEAELVGKSPRILQGPATNRETTRRIKTELSAGKNCFAEVVNYTKNGRLYDAELFISPLFDAEGHITHFVSIQRDITARKETERRLREREQRFSALIDATSDVVYRMSPDWTKMLYLEGREFIPDTHSPSPAWLERYIPADHQPRVMAAIERAIDTKSKFELEHPVLRVDGTLGWTHSRAIPIVDEAGEILEWFGAASDITPRKNAEAVQREREERLQAVLNTAYDAIVCFDHDGLITDVNAAAETIFGYAGHQFIGQHVSLILPPPCLQTPGRTTGRGPIGRPSA